MTLESHWKSTSTSFRGFEFLVKANFVVDNRRRAGTRFGSGLEKAIFVSILVILFSSGPKNELLGSIIYTISYKKSFKYFKLVAIFMVCWEEKVKGMK